MKKLNIEIMKLLNHSLTLILTLMSAVKMGIGEGIFNIDVDNPTLLKMNANNNRRSTTNSFFGFSIALEKNSAYIGAPNYIDGGALFRCNFKRSLKREVRCVIIDELHKWMKPGLYYNLLLCVLQLFSMS